LFEVDVDGATMSDLDDSQLATWATKAKEEGFDGIKIKNFSDNADYGTYTPATHYLIFDLRTSALLTQSLTQPRLTVQTCYQGYTEGQCLGLLR